jgi:uncharacterized phage-like protein YoqJ
MIIAGTGHRPDTLPGGYDALYREALVGSCIAVLKELKPTKVISGMALGFDQALAEAALELKIPLLAAIPFPAMAHAWPSQSQTRWLKIMERASEVHVISLYYYMKTYQKRNEYMVDNCDLVLALWDGSAGGTGNCVRYATKIGKPIKHLWERFYAQVGR